MKAVITVTGKDNVGIIAKVATLCSEHGANISDISQTVLSDYFAMIMLVDIKALNVEFEVFSDLLKQVGTDNSLDIHTMHEDIFNSMHRI